MLKQQFKILAASLLELVLIAITIFIITFSNINYDMSSFLFVAYIVAQGTVSVKVISITFM